MELLESPDSPDRTEHMSHSFKIKKISTLQCTYIQTRLKFLQQSGVQLPDKL